MTQVLQNPAASDQPAEAEQSAHAAADPRVDPHAVQEGIVCRRCWQVHPPGTPERCATCGAPRPAAGWPAMPYRLNERYRFQRLLGRGAMGAVFLAVDQSAPLDDAGHAIARAVKVGQRVDTAAIEVQAERFEHEAAAAGLLGRSPVFVRTFGYDTGHEPYLVMELVTWPTLGKLLRAGALSSVQAARLGVALLEALEIMHFYRMVHRDLKPSNLFVEEHDGGYRVKIADLGIWIRDHDARAPASMKTDDRIIHGTPPYMSPEQMTGNTTVGARSDLHAVGSILWECVVGEVPFPVEGDDPADQVRRRRGAVMAPLERPAAMSPELFAALARALAPDPDDRYRHCRAMIAALRDVIRHGSQGQGWVRAAQHELEALRAQLEGIDRAGLAPEMRARATSIDRGLEMLAEYLARPGAGHRAARKLLATVRADLAAVVEASDDPYQRQAAQDPTARGAGAEPALPPTVELAPTAPGGIPAEALAAEPLPPTAPMGSPPPPADPIERYTLVEMIGAGSTARIFKAAQPALDRAVALRVMHPEGISHLGIDDAAAFFEARARAAARLQHPGITPIHDYATGADGLPYLVETLLVGEDLIHHLKARRVLDPAEAVSIGGHLASALAAAHEADVVHLNLKPDRVVLEPRPGLAPTPVIFGFGFALADIPALLGGGRLYGTPAYMAPEQLDGLYGPAADVYALGTIVFRLITGLLPFWGQSVAEVLAAKRGGAPPLPIRNARQAEVPEDLRAVVAEMLRPDPAERPAAVDVATRMASIG